MCEVAVDQGSWIMVDPWEAVQTECAYTPHIIPPPDKSLSSGL